MKPFVTLLFASLLFLVPQIQLFACNLNPTAKIVISPGDNTIFTDSDNFYLHGAQSSANCGSITSYQWKVDGISQSTTSSYFFPSFSLYPGQQERSYSIQLRVQNSVGNYDYETVTITIVREHSSYYYLTDHLGSVRVTVDEQGNSVGWDDYYPFGLQMPGRTQNASNPNDDAKFTGYLLEQDGDLGLYHAEARMYDPVIGRFMQSDPMTGKYPRLSPYTYVANNPLVFVDPTGMVIEICNGSGDERNCVTYEAGMEYEGDDEFISQAIGVLNNINSVEHGASVLENLISSENFFNFENVASEGGDKTFQFVPNEEGGGTIRAASLLNSELGGFSRIESAAHELFHGYQYENGGIQGVNSEVGAYLYGRGVAATFNDGMTPGFQGNEDNPAAGDSYSSAMNNLLFGGSFIPASYSTAIQNFKQGSGVNATGLYGSKVYPVSANPPIRQFFPLVRYKN